MTKPPLYIKPSNVAVKPIYSIYRTTTAAAEPLKKWDGEQAPRGGAPSAVMEVRGDCSIFLEIQVQICAIWCNLMTTKIDSFGPTF